MYNPTTMDHFLRPRNAGALDDAEPGARGRGEAANAECGDTAVVEVAITDGVVTRARFRSKGCAGAIAACSAATEWLTGRAAADAGAIDAAAIEAHLKGFPPSKRGCSEMAAAAARAAVTAARHGAG